ncbi:uncharacterized protein N7477_000011 [Penicillium maclennaniae]|uniref:uncharacterized protein n=1 Tax=Penicillium maclennaniae TaxID=1343394 RepID=UPI00254118E5|nr:uncharacterized protein N7477_000011 [Penicillium maclennaniae]KAJ5683666.1 hypothetical protein N7477_000011 [Penicillium maclennaniae]
MSVRIISFVLIFGIFVELSAVARKLHPLIKDSLRTASDPHDWKYLISSQVQNGTSQVRFDISTSEATLSSEALLKLDGPQVSSINASVFDWWYFDAVSESDPGDSIVVTFFTSSATAFPFLDPSGSSVLIAYLWASFANGTVFSEYIPATVATVAGGDSAKPPSSGNWGSTGFSWTALNEDLSEYEVVIASEEIQVEGPDTASACGIQAGTTKLEVAPHIGWACLIPDAVGTIDMNIQGSRLSFRGPAYHDKNWSDRPFLESVQNWYWGHGRLEPYSIVWFSYSALDDPSNTTYVSSYVAKDGDVLVSACTSSILTVRPFGSFNTTGGRYPPWAGDIPDGFLLEFDLGNSNNWLKVNVSIDSLVAGDGKYYMRWTGSLSGEVVQGQSEDRQDVCTPVQSSETRLSGVAVFEQFALLE